MITLNTDRLRVEILEPMEGDNVGCRFDRAGFISDVILDKQTHFCASEPKNLSHPTSMGRGLCNEYRGDVSGEAGIGDYFPKFGIGLLQKKEDDKYRFTKQYPDRKEFPVHISHTENTAVFRTEAIPCLGYAMETEKRICVNGNKIVMSVIAANVGEKKIAFDEFCHNFLSIDGMAVGSDYKLSLPLKEALKPVRMKNRNGGMSNFRGDGKGVTFCEFTASDTDISFRSEEITDDLPFTWRMVHTGAGASVCESDDFKPGMIAIWAVDHIVAPEIICHVELNPGEKRIWKREWTFERNRGTLI